MRTFLTHISYRHAVLRLPSRASSEARFTPRLCDMRRWCDSSRRPRTLVVRGRPGCLTSVRRSGHEWCVSALGDQAELTEHGDTVVQAYLLGDQTVLDLKDGGAGKSHRLAGVRLRQAAKRQVGHRGAGVRATADPLADDVVALGD